MVRFSLFAVMALAFASCASVTPPDRPTSQQTGVVDVSEQRLTLGDSIYRVSTAGRGTGNVPGSKKTPLGNLTVINKWAPGDRDYHGRIRGYKLHLAGDNCPASRRIYIHQGRTDKATSLGCVRLSHEDVEELFYLLPVGSRIVIKP